MCLPTQVIETRGNFCPVHGDRCPQEKRAGFICPSRETHEQQNHNCLHSELEFHVPLPRCQSDAVFDVVDFSSSHIGKSTPDSNWFGTKLECVPNWQASILGG